MLSACEFNDTGMVLTPRNKTDIHSPNFPETYPNNLDCKWHIKADNDLRIELQLKGQELEEK